VKALPDKKELLIIDGGSTDGTKKIVREWSVKYSNIRLLENPDKYVPFALNIAVRKSSGDPIIRVDAHTVYSEDYFVKILDTFEETSADVVGGPTRIKANSNFQKAVEKVLSSRFGVGNNKIHDSQYRGYVDHVTFGAWRKKIFKEVGYFDERLKRNQDDEFHYRAKSLGKKIYLNPEIKSYYYPRNSFSKLIKQYFQYGLYKPIVLNKIRSEIKLRHLIPPLFALYILSLPLALISTFYLLPLFVYILLDIYFSIHLKSSIKVMFYSALIYPIVHWSYGFGLLIGLLRMGNTN
jgi:glycosyltransferase involved in cell wall biosynthesis